VFNKALEFVVIKNLVYIFLNSVHYWIPVFLLGRFRINSILPYKFNDFKLLTQSFIYKKFLQIEVLITIILCINMVHLEYDVDEPSIDQLRFFAQAWVLRSFRFFIKII